MRSRRRVIAALALALACAPGTWLRTPVPDAMPSDITLTPILGPHATDTPGWSLGGVWQYSAQSRYFGGFSAILALYDHKLRAFSDRGTRFTFVEPDQPEAADGDLSVVYQAVEDAYSNDLWDIEAATRDPATGDYWLSYENYHAIHRFSQASERKGVRVLDDEVDWPVNGGAEAMVRLADGRFVIIPEGRDEALIFASDPVEHPEAARTIVWQVPAPGYVVTDMAQLPDGRLLMLLRDLELAYPPFVSLLAIADPPPKGGAEAWSGKVVFALDGVVPRENYEGLTLREEEDGKVAVWVIADDNQSVQQRTLLVKLLFDPAVER
jgi:hypothetical protein